MYSILNPEKSKLKFPKRFSDKNVHATANWWSVFCKISFQQFYTGFNFAKIKTLEVLLHNLDKYMHVQNCVCAKKLNI